MKKLICLFLFSLLSSGLFAKDFIIRDYHSINEDFYQMVFLTQEKNGNQYSVMVVSKSQNEDLYWKTWVKRQNYVLFSLLK